MHLTRFVDPHGRLRYGKDRGDGTAELLADSAFPDPQSLTGEVVEIAQRRAPIAPPNIFCIGLNYREHATETGAPIPERPVIFMKPTTTLCDPGSPVVIPASQMKGPEVDSEAELGIVMGTKDGQPAKDVSEADALDYVLGYTCGSDISARRWQKQGGGGQWVRGKGFDSFCPLGPVIVTQGEGDGDIADPQQLSITGKLNDTVMQSSHTSDMIFSVAEIVAFLSRDTTLLPGTLILTGTPPGVGFVREPAVWVMPGDELTVEIEKIGTLRNPVVQA
ncbi:fumarylacetoacetate hydrolase family protein [Algisphaera agarilytica]|uniref:2-keto-4-pentenoate hydratase/2-oxohepta-3-ene-1,7-dioic acid hydratase in catechol pathway n=1 Tax=Algisphaera agarilytica TaxID=1385975 RepID=A0A7X0LJH1_9BACT|nr:fumarylacetoacetate hydrolase family protein [Algisphaera agarilytica]MBB6428596.1 2-keto-4-pentenoate hydratase/2-oxohepta-3-ene-1,7-dioic acid hydratase in catechol pathway [Algisphaera agarilytica]